MEPGAPERGRRPRRDRDADKLSRQDMIAIGDDKSSNTSTSTPESTNRKWSWMVSRVVQVAVLTLQRLRLLNMNRISGPDHRGRRRGRQGRRDH